MTANIRISSVKLSPDPVDAGKTFIISVGIEDRIFGISTAGGRMIRRAAGEVIATKKG